MAVPKGTGSGMWRTMTILPPSAGAEGIKKFVVNSVQKARTNTCPPELIGVEVSGTAAKMTRWATPALLRPINM